MREVRPGIWHWQAPHPEWTPEADWPELVSSYAIDDGEHLLLFDPLAPPSLIDEFAVGRRPVVVLTCPWHVRDAPAVVERLGAPLYTPPPGEGDGPLEGHVFTAGERLPVGVEALPGLEHNDLVLWIESRRALVAGDTVVDRGDGLEVPADWVDAAPPEQILAALRPLLDLPVELVLPTHGDPTDRAALARALA